MSAVTTPPVVMKDGLPIERKNASAAWPPSRTRSLLQHVEKPDIISIGPIGEYAGCFTAGGG